MIKLTERTLIDLGTLNFDPAGLQKVTSRGQVALVVDSKGKIDYNSPSVRGLDQACPRLDTSPESKLNFALLTGRLEIPGHAMSALLGSPEAFDEFGLDSSLRIESMKRNKEGRDQNYVFCSAKTGQFVTDLAKKSSWSDCKLTNTTHSRGKGKGRKSVTIAKFTPKQAWVQYTESGLPIVFFDLGKSQF